MKKFNKFTITIMNKNIFLNKNELQKGSIFYIASIPDAKINETINYNFKSKNCQ